MDADNKVAKLIAAIDASARQLNRFIAELKKLHQLQVQMSTGIPGQCDPEFPCADFSPEEPSCDQ